MWHKARKIKNYKLQIKLFAIIQNCCSRWNNYDFTNEMSSITVHLTNTASSQF